MSNCWKSHAAAHIASLDTSAWAFIRSICGYAISTETLVTGPYGLLMEVVYVDRKKCLVLKEIIQQIGLAQFTCVDMPSLSSGDIIDVDF